MESYMTKDDDIIQSLIKQLALKPSDGDSIEALKTSCASNGMRQP